MPKDTRNDRITKIEFDLNAEFPRNLTVWFESWKPPFHIHEFIPGTVTYNRLTKLESQIVSALEKVNQLGGSYGKEEMVP